MVSVDTFALIKPDASRRMLVGKIITMIERYMVISDLRMLGAQHERAKRTGLGVLYQEHSTRPYFHDLIEFMESGPLYAMRLTMHTHDAVSRWRNLMGPTPDDKRMPGQIRYEFARGYPPMENLVHGSDSDYAADRELKMAREFGWLSA